MDYRLNRIDSEEKNRILSLHESATKKEYLSTGKKPLFEQGSADYMVDAKSKELAKSGGDIEPSTQPEMTNAQNAANLIFSASKGLGTSENELIRGVMKIRSVEEFKEVDNLLKATNYGDSDTGFVNIINGELGLYNSKDAKEIVDHLKTIGITATFEKDGSSMVNNSFKITGFSKTQQQGIGKERDLNWGDRYACVANYEGAEKVQLKDKSHAYKINGVVFYNNGRKMENGQMSNYSCNDKMFQGKQQGDQQRDQQRGSSLRDTTIAIQKEIGVDPDGRFGPKSINAAYEALTK